MTRGAPINAERLWRRLDALAAITDPARPWTRRSFTPLHHDGRAWLAAAFSQAGLAVEVDAAGNLLGRRPGSTPGRKPIACGSHSDTVPSGGRYDGMLGVLAALEVAQSLAEQQVALRHPLEIIDFLAEEPSEFGLSCVGSSTLTGAIDADALAIRRTDGSSLADGLRAAGGDPAGLAGCRRHPGDLAAFVELHIEQGPVLEAAGLAVGVVSDIVGIRRLALTIDGQADHAGTTPMHLRRDALVGAARLVDAIHREARRLDGAPHYVVATVGRFDVSPNVVNAVPAQVRMVLEVRSNAGEILQTLPRTVFGQLAGPLDELGLALQVREISLVPPTHCDERIQGEIERAAQALGLTHRRLPSGAGHDAMWMSGLGPIGMIFVPCRGGRSHCPEESIEPRQAADGAGLLYETIRRLDRDLDV